MMKLLKTFGKRQSDGWFVYVENDVFCSSFVHARCSKSIKTITGLGRKIHYHYRRGLEKFQWFEE